MADQKVQSSQTQQAPVEEPEVAEELEAEESAPEAPAAPAPSTAAAVKKALRELKLKIDGKEVTEKLPFELPDSPEAIEYMQRQLQLGKMGQSRAQQAAALQKEITDWVEQLRKDPKTALSMPNLGVDLKKLAQQVIEEEIENSKKTPDQLEKEKLQAKLREIEDERKKEKADWDKREAERLQELHYEQYESRMIKALDGSDLPKSPYVVKKMADYMLMGLQNNIDLSPEDVLPIVREEITNDIKEMFAVMPAEVVEKLIGKDKFNTIRKARVAKAKEVPQPPVTKSIKDAGAIKAPKEDKSANKKQTYKDFFKV
jgi:hypothetical protein